MGESSIPWLDAIEPAQESSLPGQMLLRPRKQLVPQLFAPSPSHSEGSTKRRIDIKSPEPKPPALRPGRLGGPPAPPSEDRDPDSTCVMGCLCVDAAHIGLCVTAEGKQPPSIKRSHARFKEAHIMTLSADETLSVSRTLLLDE
jgi:hypothetical protein